MTLNHRMDDPTRRWNVAIRKHVCTKLDHGQPGHTCICPCGVDRTGKRDMSIRWH